MIVTTLLITMFILFIWCLMLTSYWIRQSAPNTQKDLELRLLELKGRKGYIFDLRKYEYELDGGYSLRMEGSVVEKRKDNLFCDSFRRLLDYKCIVIMDDYAETYIVESPAHVIRRKDAIYLRFDLGVAFEDANIKIASLVNSGNGCLGATGGESSCIGFSSAAVPSFSVEAGQQVNITFTITL